MDLKNSKKNQKGIVAVSHQKGGVGKSTLIWNLITLYSKYQIVDVIDLDVQKTITYSISTRKQHGLDIKNINLLEVRGKEEKVSDNLMMELMQESQNKGRLTLIDCGGFDSNSNRLAMAASDILLTPVSTKFYELLGLKMYEKILKDLTSKLRDGQKLIANVILNKINPNTKELKDIMDFINGSEYFHLMNTIIRQRTDYENSPGMGMNVVEYDKNGKAAGEIISLKKELDNILL